MESQLFQWWHRREIVIQMQLAGLKADRRIFLMVHGAMGIHNISAGFELAEPGIDPIDNIVKQNPAQGFVQSPQVGFGDGFGEHISGTNSRFKGKQGVITAGARTPEAVAILGHHCGDCATV